MRIQRCNSYLNPIKTDRDLAQTSGELAEPAGCPAGSPLPTAISLPGLLTYTFHTPGIRIRRPLDRARARSSAIARSLHPHLLPTSPAYRSPPSRWIFIGMVTLGFPGA